MSEAQITPIIAAEIFSMRLDLDLSQADFAERLGVSHRTIVNWEARGVPSSKVLKVRRTLGLDTVPEKHVCAELQLENVALQDLVDELSRRLGSKPAGESA